MNTTLSIQGGSFLHTATEPRDILLPEDVPSEIREAARAICHFFRTEVIPRFDEIDARNTDATPTLLRKLAELGFFQAEVPTALGGMELPLGHVVPMVEELGRAGAFGVAAMVHQGIGMQPIASFAQPKVAAKYMDRLMSADLIGAYALTEPGYGSDALAGATTATADGEHWVLNGSKQFITNAAWAGVFTVFAQAGPKKFTAFLVERDTPGLEILKEEHKMGIQGSSTCGLRLTNVRVPASHLLGEVGRGHKIALNLLNAGRLKVGITMIGAMKQLLEYSAVYARDRRQFGRPISSFGLLRRKFARMGELIFSAEAMASRIAHAIDVTTEAMKPTRGAEAKIAACEEFSSECSIAKVWLSEAAAEIADDAVQIHGGYGFSEEYPVARFYRDLRVARIYEGTNEINRINTVNSLLRRRLKGEEATAWLDALGAAVNEPGEGEVPVMRRAVAHAMLSVGRTTEARDGGLEQDVVGALADMMAALYVGESAFLRLEKLHLVEDLEPDTQDLAVALTELALASAADRIRNTANQVIGAMGLPGHDVVTRLEESAARLAGRRFEWERRAAELLLAHEGAWPEFA